MQNENTFHTNNATRRSGTQRKRKDIFSDISKKFFAVLYDRCALSGLIYFKTGSTVFSPGENLQTQQGFRGILSEQQ